MPNNCKKRIYCDICPEYFYDKKGYEKHINQHYECAEEFPCSKCGWSFYTRTDYEDHISLPRHRQSNMYKKIVRYNEEHKNPVEEQSDQMREDFTSGDVTEPTELYDVFNERSLNENTFPESPYYPFPSWVIFYLDCWRSESGRKLSEGSWRELIRLLHKLVKKWGDIKYWPLSASVNKVNRSATKLASRVSTASFCYHSILV